MSEKFVIYDIETLSNFFSIAFKDFKSGKEKFFIIHEHRNDLDMIIGWLRKFKRENYWMVGYNNLGFDAQVIEYLIRNRREFKFMHPRLLTTKIYNLAQEIINMPDEEKYMNLLPEWKLTIPQIDIYKQRHYNSKNKRTSLKWLEFTMRFPNIRSMPIRHDDEIKETMFSAIKEYNLTDTGATAEFFKRVKFETDLRLTLSHEYQLNLMNASEPRLAREIFGKFLSEKMGVDYRDLKERRTYRKTIFTKQILFKYIKFEDPMLQGALDFYRKLTFNPYNFQENNMGLEEVNKVFKFHNLQEVVIGLGGIHACINSGVYTSNPDWVIHDIDVKSFYPNLGIQNNLYPEHLSEDFCVVYNELYEKRTTIPKESPINYIFKIILNSAYGLSKEPNNYFHDPKYTFSITINGQLLLLMLAEFIRKEIPDCKFYQFNTDGVTVGYHPKFKDKVKKAMDKWMKLTRLELEEQFYTKMVIKDVNNYIAVNEKGKVKRKGAAFAYSMNPEDKELDYHKNPSALIIPKALEQYFIYGVPVEKYVKESRDIFDFCLGSKIKRDFDIEMYTLKNGQLHKEILHEQVVRYYVSRSTNCSLKKKYKSHAKKYGQKPTDLQKKWNMTYYNQHVEMPFEDYKVDYRFYLERIRKIIKEVDSNMQNLKLEFPE